MAHDATRLITNPRLPLAHRIPAPQSGQFEERETDGIQRVTGQLGGEVANGKILQSNCVTVFNQGSLKCQSFV